VLNKSESLRPAPALVPFLQRAARYGLVGVLNGVVSLSLIGVLDLGLHVQPGIANAAGYAVGVVLSFTLARTFVFRSDGRVGKTGPRYLAVAAAGFVMNQIMLRLMLGVVGPGVWRHTAAQLSGIATYTVFVFLACQVWVFRPAQSTARSGSEHAG
jgi:putative flippase GtrA